MNDDNKDPNSKPAGTPTETSEADDNPWDEDDGGGRTLATDGPSFELPSNIPSPITVPPPPVAKGPAASRPRSPTMMGFGPMAPPIPGASPAAPARPIGAIAPAPAPKAAAAPASSRGVPTAPRAPAPPPMAGAPAPRIGGGAPQSNRLPLPSGRMPSPPAVPASKGGGGPSTGEESVPASSSTMMMENAPVRPAPAAPRAPAPAPAPARPAPPAPAKADEPWDDDDSNHDDGPTMAGAPLMPDVPLRDDVVNPRPSPLASTGYQPGMVDKDAETVALKGDDGDLPPIGAPVDAEETTRAVSREELLGHQGAQVILGDDDDAHGDEATLAVAPGALGDLVDPALVAALSERQPRQPSQPEPPSAPVFPPPPPGPPPGYGSQGGMGSAQQQQQPQSQPQQPVQSWQGEPPSYRNPPQQPMGAMGMQQGYDPMLSQGHQSSPGMHSAPQQQGYPMQGGYGPNANAPTPGGQQMQPVFGQQWQAAPAAGGGFAKKFTPQVIMLIVVGTVCLSIFVIGIVLFVTTNFQRP